MIGIDSPRVTGDKINKKPFMGNFTQSENPVQLGRVVEAEKHDFQLVWNMPKDRTRGTPG